MSNKRGTHVGMILSFLIFVTFLAFLYSVTQPATKVKQDKMDLLNFLETELLDKLSENLITVTVKFNAPPTTQCVKFDNFDRSLNGVGAIVKNVTEPGGAEVEKKINSLVEGNYITISGTTQKIKFYYSSQFSLSQGPVCSNIPPLSKDTYEIALFRTTREIFESKVNNISAEISASRDYYNNLKDGLGLAFDDEFGFSFLDSNKNVINGTEEREVNLDIYSEEIPIQYIDKEANIKPGFMIIKVW